MTEELLVGAFFSLLILGSGAFYWLMTEFRASRREGREDNRATRDELRQEIRNESQERRADTQRILEALYFHRHDSDGAAVFYPPTPASTAPPAAD
jgi:hypothetical protein